MKRCAGAGLGVEHPHVKIRRAVVRGNNSPGLQPIGDDGIARRGYLKPVSLSIPPAILSDTVSALEFSSRKKIRPFVSSE